MTNSRWQSYTNERFDWLTTQAALIADEARRNGRLEPAYGYSIEDWLEAKRREENLVAQGDTEEVV